MPSDHAPDSAPGKPGLALELLVHGVGGTTPAEMLGDPRTERVTGDSTAAIHRRTDDVDAERHPEDYAGRPVPEAYCWSNLTSGNGARALWLILLPFMVANLAHWTRPAAHGRRRTVRLHGLLVRLIALSLTVLLIAAACEVALDLIAWQCAGSERCAQERTWLGFMAAPQGPGDLGGWWSQPGRRLALAAVLPTAVTVLLWWLSHRTWSAYESQPPLERTVPEDDPAADGRPPLSLPGFWYGKRLVARLRAAHTAAGFLTVAGALTAATTKHDRTPGGNAVLDVCGWLLTGLVLAGAVWVLYVVCRRGRKESEPDDEADSPAVHGLPGASLAVLLLAVVHSGWSRPGWTSSGPLPGDEAFGVLAVLQGALVVALGVLGLRLHRLTRVPRTALAGLASGCVGMLACGLGGLLSGGVSQRVGDWLDGPGTPGQGGGHIAGPPIVLTWQASIIPVLLALVLLLACWFVFRVWRDARRLTDDVAAGYPDSLPDESRSRRIASAIARAGLTDQAPWLVATVAAATLVLGGVAVVGTLWTGQVPGEATDGAPDFVAGFADTVQTLGSWLVGFAFVLLLAWSRRAYKDASARRTVGILWDVGTFWPRCAHPFAPPCYAERAVPDLAWRMAMWTDQRPERRLVISGHSQGSVLAAAAVWQLDPDTRRQIALLTYGSPLERLYGRWFPAYFGPHRLASFHGGLECWRNLWRLTDPIGGPVRPESADTPEPGPPEECRGVDRGPLRDPLVYGRTRELPLPEPILAHGDYQADPAFAQERAGLLARLEERSVRFRQPTEGVPRQPEPEPESVPDPAADRLRRSRAGQTGRAG
ncbi:lipase family protein [Streptomyces sp. 891-h]|uniref:lipase family protein n=1 Tax=Streptomyces sp. 891-h TaxID=2720714 RepID=UPI001FA9AFDC|nr:lipase family protein [Streptomyces sp. 891-h]UNZ20777.1 lipase family protein [Streptomyces sp. 891-h]